MRWGRLLAGASSLRVAPAFHCGGTAERRQRGGIWPRSDELLDVVPVRDAHASTLCDWLCQTGVAPFHGGSGTLVSFQLRPGSAGWTAGSSRAGAGVRPHVELSSVEPGQQCRLVHVPASGKNAQLCRKTVFLDSGIDVHVCCEENRSGAILLVVGAAIARRRFRGRRRKIVPSSSSTSSASRGVGESRSRDVRARLRPITRA